MQKQLCTLTGIGAMSGLSTSRRALQPGERIGPYQLVQQLGEGGMAEVWLAQRVDGTFSREVALKMPLSGLHENLARRFTREREILATLEHPNIARMYDAGISPEGLPYLVMEYVRGEPLMGWCDARRLTVRERLRLFLQVLDAVQYAHSHQVIHRDIKPGNVLVNDAGQVRLLDFGVAKLLTQDDEHTELTRLYGRALTPEYASPELVRGEAIDTAADVYSLGVVMYELLCGCRPYRVKTGTSVRLLGRIIGSTRIERPSTRVGPEAGSARGATRAELVQGLRGDLDAIVLKALAKSTRNRYRSAAEMADDLQCYLTGEPAQAGSGRFFHRFSNNFLRRRPKPTSSMSAGQDRARTQFTETLGVSYVLEGSVRKSGNTLRINARLIDVNGSHLWSRTCDRKSGDLLELQDEISRDVVQELAIAFLSIETTEPSGPARASSAVSEAPTLTTELISSDPDLPLEARR